jgi:hypothetical protein
LSIARAKHLLDRLAIRDEALEIVRGLVGRLVHSGDSAAMEIELVGDIARMVDLGLELAGGGKAALDERTACSVKVVAGTYNHRKRLISVAI